jgi:uncharacterized membrane protein YbhN (UPF0104 family)
MNPFRLAGALPSRPWLRLGLGILGLALLLVIAHRVDWRQFRTVFLSLRWGWVLASLLLGGCAMGARSLRLAWILEAPSQYGGVWRSVCMGYLGTFFLPLGGGELVKVGALRMLLGLPAVPATAGVFLDRLFDLLGLAFMVGALIGTGVAVQLRAGPVWTAALAAAALALVLGTFLLLRRRAIRGGTGAPSRIGHMLDHLLELLSRLRRPADLGRLLAAQAAIVALDVGAIRVGLQAFAFGPPLPLMTSVKLGAYIQLGAALPLLPGGAGTFQAACVLALQPAGVSTAKAFAYSLFAQGAGFGLCTLLGLAAALWPRRDQALSRPGGTA